MDNKRRISMRVQYVLIIVLAIAIGTILYYILYRIDLNRTVYFELNPVPVSNPLMGFAPDAGNIEYCEKSNLVFVLLRWADWERKQGEYDTNYLEETCHLARWREEKKHAVLRFVCDIPGEEKHLDIPDWLATQTDDGIYYETDAGKGYSPNYANPVFMTAHEKALRSLAEYCNRDGFIAFVEMGSLGHWGEWHASDQSGNSMMPDAEVCEEYIHLYADSFANARILARRNYTAAIEEGTGFYNDMIGDLAATEEWLGWMQKGGSQETAGKPLQMSAARGAGKLTPNGGEFASGMTGEALQGETFGNILASMIESGLTFIGPAVPDLTDESLAVILDSILRRIGYRIYVSGLEMQYNFAENTIDMALTWKNEGNAGFFFDWPVNLYIYNGQRQPVYWETLNLDLRSLNREEQTDVRVHVPLTAEIRDEFYIGIGITDYTGTERVSLAFDPEQITDMIDGVQILYHYRK